MRSPRTSFLGACLILALASAQARAEGRPAAEILADHDAIVVPRYDGPGGRSPDYRAAVERHTAAALPLLRRQADLALELFHADPGHPRVAELMLKRWRGVGSRDRPATEREIDEALARPGNPALRAHALWFRSVLRLASARRGEVAPEAALAAVDALAAEFPADARGADLLYGLSTLPPAPTDFRARVERRLVFEYPEAQLAKLVAGKLRRPDAIGKPFELEFDDAIGGRHVAMKDLRGRVVVIDFWATWCGPCKAEMPHLKALYEKYPREEVEFLGVSLDRPQQDGLNRLKDYVARNAIPWPQYYDGKGTDGELHTSWGVAAIPDVFVIGRDGNVFATDAGDKLEATIAAALAAPGPAAAGK